MRNKLKRAIHSIAHFLGNYSPPKVLVEILLVLMNSSLIRRIVCPAVLLLNTQNGYKTSLRREKKYWSQSVHARAPGKLWPHFFLQVSSA